MKIYVVNYKETEIDVDNVIHFESGVCDYGYQNEEDAKKKARELADDKIDALIDNGAEQEEVEHESGEDYELVYHDQDTYEYTITIVEIL